MHIYHKFCFCRLIFLFHSLYHSPFYVLSHFIFFHLLHLLSFPDAGFDVDLTLNFLFKLSHTDVNILKDIKQATEGRSNVLHNATVVAHAYMNAGMHARY
jgi:hypothetical protein